MPLQASADRLALAPPPEPGQARAFSLALLAHLLLGAALTWGISWNRDSREVTAEAELWSPTVQQAAPPLVETPPPPPPPPAPAKVLPPPPPPAKDAEIAVARDKAKQEAQKAAKAREELERQKRDKAEADRKAAEKRAADKKAAEKQLADQKAERDKKARDEAEAKRVAQLREENLQRMQGLAGATGAPTATGTAQKSAGPSDSYAGRIRAKVKPNIVFTEDIQGNPVTEVEVKMTPDGTITSRRITKSSNNKAWDDAVLRALDRTEVLPRDVDGRVHSPLIMEFRPRG
jgi:colicin import membrane protein